MIKKIGNGMSEFCHTLSKAEYKSMCDTYSLPSGAMARRLEASTYASNILGVRWTSSVCTR